MTGWKETILNSGSLLPLVVVDESWVRVKGKDARIHVALNPRTLRIIYLEPFFRRDEYTTNLFLEHLVEKLAFRLRLVPQLHHGRLILTRVKDQVSQTRGGLRRARPLPAPGKADRVEFQYVNAAFSFD